MESRIYAPVLWIVLCILPFSLKAQEYREAAHSCFKLEKERVLSLDGSEFHTGKEWSGKQVIASIPSLPVPCSLTINGFPFGKLEAGRISPVEYNITPFLKKELNRLKLVPEDSSAFQDPLPGCSLLIRDAIHIRDLIVTDHPGLSVDESLVRVQLFIKSYLRETYRNRSIHLDLRDPDGKSIIQESRVLGSGLSYGQETEMHFDLVLENPVLWHPDTPDVYELVLSMKADGAQKPELVSKQFAIISLWHNDSLLIQDGDTLLLKYASGNQAETLSRLNEEECKAFVEETGINAIKRATPPACHQEALLQRCGILVVSDSK